MREIIDQVSGSGAIIKHSKGTELYTGGVKAWNPVWLAPLAGITNFPVRRFFLKLGAGLVHTEMISCAGLQRGMDKTTRMLDTAADDMPLVLQLFAGDVKTLLAGVEVALERGGFSAIGINMACPMPKVQKKGAGARLLGNPDLAFEMVDQLRETGLPVWVKIRKCSPDHPLNTFRFCEGLINAGASNIAIHGRTSAQRYEGTSDRLVITEAASHFRSMITASGDIFHPRDVVYFLDHGCSGVVIARGAMRDPFIFPKALRQLGYKVPDAYIDPSIDLQVNFLTDLGDEIEHYYNDRFAEIIVRRVMSGMFKGIPGISGFRQASSDIHGWNELKTLLQNSFLYFERRNL